MDVRELTFRGADRAALRLGLIDAGTVHFGVRAVAITPLGRLVAAKLTKERDNA